MIGPVCDLLLVKDTRVVVMVTLEGLECVMKAGIANKMEYVRTEWFICVLLLCVCVCCRYRENRIASVTLIPPIPNNNSN